MLNVTSTPALPIPVPVPITTTTSVADAMLHEEAAAPDDGVEPTFAVHVCDVMKLLPITVIELLTYPETGDSDPYVAPPTTVSSAPEVSAVAPDPPPLNTTRTIAAPALVPLPTTTRNWLLITTVHDDADVDPTVAEHPCPSCVIRNLAPVNVIVLSSYAAVGAMLLTIGLSLTTSALLVVLAITDAGFDIAI